MVIGDADGVVVVPRAGFAAVKGRLAAIRRAEAELDARVKGGLTMPEWLDEFVASGRIREVD